jgi:hypothetical protein
MDRRTPPRTTAPRRVRAFAAPLALATGAALSFGLVLTGCSSATKAKTSSAASSALAGAQSLLASIGSEAGSQAASAASSALSAAASAGSSVLAGAQSEAASAFASATGGVDARDDVTLGTATPTSDGKLQVPVTAANRGSGSARFTVQVNFKDASGALQDTAVLTIGPVAQGQTGTGTAVSHRSFSGTVTPSVGVALRY